MGVRAFAFALLGLMAGCAHFSDPQLPAGAYGVVELPWHAELAEPPAVPFAVVDVFEAFKRARLQAESDEEVVELFEAELEPWRDLLEGHAPGLYGSSDLTRCVAALNERYYELWAMHRGTARELAWAYAHAQQRFPALAFGGTVFVVPGCMDAQGEAGIETDTIALSLASIDSSGGSVTRTFHHELFHHYHAVQAPALFDGDTTLHEVVWREGLATWAAAEMGSPSARSWRDADPVLMREVAAIVRDEPESRSARRLQGTIDPEQAPRTVYELGAVLVERLARDVPEPELVCLEGEALLTRMLSALEDGVFIER